MTEKFSGFETGLIWVGLVGSVALLVLHANRVDYSDLLEKLPEPPSNIEGAPTKRARVRAVSGRVYDVLMWPSKDGLTYSVAVLIGVQPDPAKPVELRDGTKAPAWIALLRETAGNRRVLHSIKAADFLEESLMKIDWITS